MVAALLAVSGCGSGGHTSTTSSATQASLGRVPVPTAPAAEPTSTADVAHPAVLDMGAPVIASLGHGISARVTITGPTQSTTRPGAPSTEGTFTIQVHPVSGAVRMSAADFSSRNEDGRPVALRSQGPSTTTATTTREGSLRLVGRYSSGAAQVTWKHDGRPVAVWDFNIELD